MTPISARLVRLSLVYLVAGATIGSLLLVAKATGTAPRIWILRPLHVEFLLFGFMVQFAFGVGSWILPRTPSRYSMRPVVAAAVLLNVGLWLVGVSDLATAPMPFAQLHEGVPADTLVGTAGRIFETAAFAAFAYHVWPRVRAFNIERKG